MLQYKVEILQDFLHKHRDLPKQGTAEWHAIRGIGGSELNMLLKDEASLVANKVGLKKIPDMLAMRWGNLLEDTLRNTVSTLLRTTIFEASSVPSAEVVGKTFSMDGLGIVRFLATEWNGRPARFFVDLLTLFEFKCPFSRTIVPGEIYRDYIPQVLSGMSDLAIPEIALYVEGVFRVCRYEMLGSNSHVETWLHRGGNPAGLCPMTYGFIGFYMEQPEIPDDPEADSLIRWLQRGTTDFGMVESAGLLNRLLKFMKSGIVKLWSSSMSYVPSEFARCGFFAQHRVKIPNIDVDMDDQLAEFYRWTRVNQFMPLGILGFKLLDLNIVPIEKQPGYTKQFEPQIHAALEKINQLKAIEDMDERDHAWHVMYGKKQKTEITETEMETQMDAMASYLI